MMAGVFAIAIAWSSASLPASSVVPDSTSLATPRRLSPQELRRVESRLNGRSTARVSRAGTWFEIRDPSAKPEGLDYVTALGPRAGELPNPLPWSEVDTVWVRGSRAGLLAFLGAVVGGAALLGLGDPQGAGDYEGLARVSLLGTGAALGAAAGAWGGSRLHTWRAVYPVDPRELRPRGRSLF